MRLFSFMSVVCLLLAACGGSSSKDPDPVDPSLDPITINSITLSGSSDEDATVTARIDPTGADVAVADGDADLQAWSLTVTSANLSGLNVQTGVDMELTAVDDLGNEQVYTTEISITTAD